jgi:hypothetical protein
VADSVNADARKRKRVSIEGSRGRKFRAVAIGIALVSSALLVAAGLRLSDGVDPNARVDAAVSSHPAVELPDNGQSTGKMVFAHYFPPYPLSIDNLPSGEDYYATQYLNPNGERGSYAAFGGFLRDRPQPRPVSADPQWRQRDLEDEVRQAIDAGISGFSVDILTKSSNPLWSSSVPSELLAASAAVDPAFEIMLMPDMNGELGTLDPANLAGELSQYASSPSVFRLTDNRVVISPFLAEKHDPAWWSQFLEIMKARYGIEVALSTWGGRNPSFNPVTDTGIGSPLDQVNRAHALGKIWMQSVSFQDARPSQSVFDEAQNTGNLRNTWQIARESDSEWVQLISWNDYSEGTAFAPSEGHGRALLDLNAYFVDWFKTGTAPAITRDIAYVTYRNQLSSAQPALPSVSPMILRAGSSPVRDTIEVLTFLVEGAEVKVTVGGTTTTCSADTGMDICTVPSAVGAVSVSVVRNGTEVSSVKTHADVASTPAVQNMEYLVDSSFRR